MVIFASPTATITSLALASHTTCGTHCYQSTLKLCCVSFCFWCLFVCFWYFPAWGGMQLSSGLSSGGALSAIWGPRDGTRIGCALGRWVLTVGHQQTCRYPSQVGVLISQCPEVYGLCTHAGATCCGLWREKNAAGSPVSCCCSE